MSEIPQDLSYTEEHEYIRETDEKGVVVIGITDFAQSELGDVVFVELPDVGSTYKRNDVFGTIEAVKAVSELFSPLSGEVIEINEELDADPSLVNNDPYGAGWMIKLRVADTAEVDDLLTAEAYEAFIS